MKFGDKPNPEELVPKIAQLHLKGTSPNGMFGFPVPTALGKMQRTVIWEKSWAKAFTRQLQDVMRYDTERHGSWPELDAACKQLIDVVIPRLLGVLQSDGREIKPTLIHGDIWERNLGVDMETNKLVVFDPGCTYAHNEREFGEWRAWWAYYFSSAAYLRVYKRYIGPSEPASEFRDRQRLYTIHSYFNDSAGHDNSKSRRM